MNNRFIGKCVDALYSFIGVYAADLCYLLNERDFMDYVDMVKRERRTDDGTKSDAKRTRGRNN